MAVLPRCPLLIRSIFLLIAVLILILSGPVQLSSSINNSSGVLITPIFQIPFGGGFNLDLIPAVEAILDLITVPNLLVNCPWETLVVFGLVDASPLVALTFDSRMKVVYGFLSSSICLYWLWVMDLSMESRFFISCIFYLKTTCFEMRLLRDPH